MSGQSWRDELEQISDLLRHHLVARPDARVLEAGCGSASRLRFPPEARIVGIDISGPQLEKNPLIHERVLGDLQTYDHEPASFDAIVCWDVLEHLADPIAALKRLVVALRPHGLLILGFPDRRSIKARVTRAMPFRAHIWFYRWVLGNTNAGRDSRGPFPTPMHREMDRDAIVASMHEAGLTVVRDFAYESDMQLELRRRLRLVGKKWAALDSALSVITAGRIRAATTECALVLSRRAANESLQA